MSFIVRAVRSSVIAGPGMWPASTPKSSDAFRTTSGERRCGTWAGVPRSVAMKLTGHKTESVYRRYAIVSEADLSEGLKRLATLNDRDARAIEQSRSVTVHAQS